MSGIVTSEHIDYLLELRNSCNGHNNSIGKIDELLTDLSDLKNSETLMEEGHNLLEKADLIDNREILFQGLYCWLKGFYLQERFIDPPRASQELFDMERELFRLATSFEEKLTIKLMINEIAGEKPIKKYSGLPELIFFRHFSYWKGKERVLKRDSKRSNAKLFYLSHLSDRNTINRLDAIAEEDQNPDTEIYEFPFRSDYKVSEQELETMIEHRHVSIGIGENHKTRRRNVRYITTREVIIESRNYDSSFARATYVREDVFDTLKVKI